MITELILCGLFSDHMVLQQERENAFWGKDCPSQLVRVVIEAPGAQARVVETKADAEGRWRVLIPPLPAGLNYRIKVKGSSEKAIEDVAVGEVWLASGQSNMEWPLVNTDGASEELAKASHPNIRSIKVARTPSRQPREEVPGTWEACTPQSAGQFTAVGYYFARELAEKNKVPVGIINSTWGGTRIEAWVSEQALSPVIPLEKELKELADGEKNREAVTAEYRERVGAWERLNFAQDLGRGVETLGWEKAATDEGAWTPLKSGQSWQAQGFKHHGAVWYRTVVDIAQKDAGKDLELNLGLVDDFDHSYFNGELVGSMPQGTPDAYSLERRYVVPGKLVHPGPNLIAVRVFDQVGDGGLLGADSTRWYRVVGDKTVHSLSSDWKARVEKALPLIGNDIWSRSPAKPAILQIEQTPGALYNGMIHPLEGYGLRGVIWYQGEANVDQWSNYENLMRALMRDWRTRWGGGTMPFLYCQLAAFQAGETWPRLREAQAAALSEPLSGMAVLMDVGNSTDIHPRNKREVGRRLGLLAQKRAYGDQNIVDAGPTFASLQVSGSTMRVQFDNAIGLFTRDKNAQVLGFEVAGSDRVFKAAKARIVGSSVEVTCEEVPHPVALRYAWKDYLELNLMNAANLPAAPFRTDAW